VLLFLRIFFLRSLLRAYLWLETSQESPPFFYSRPVFSGDLSLKVHPGSGCSARAFLSDPSALLLFSFSRVYALQGTHSRRGSQRRYFDPKTCSSLSDTRVVFFFVAEAPRPSWFSHSVPDDHQPARPCSKSRAEFFIPRSGGPTFARFSFSGLFDIET